MVFSFIGNCLGTGACALFIVCLCQPVLVYALGPDLTWGCPLMLRGDLKLKDLDGEDAEAKKRCLSYRLSSMLELH